MDQHGTSDSRKRARSSTPNVSVVASDAREHHTDLSRTSAVARVSYDSLCHIFSYLDRRRPCVFATMARVSRAWKGAAYMEELWVMAAHTLVPATVKHEHPQVRKLLRAVGGYRALVLKYAEAICRSSSHRPHSSPLHPGSQKMGLDWLKEPRQVISELRDCVHGRMLLSEVGEPEFRPQETYEQPGLHANKDAAVYALTFTRSDMLLPWEDQDTAVSQIFTEHDRFHGRMLIVNPFTGRITVVFSTPPYGKYAVHKGPSIHTYQSEHGDFPHARGRGKEVQGSLWFQLKETNPKGKLYEFSGMGLDFQTQDSSCRGIADVVHAMYNAA